MTRSDEVFGLVESPAKLQNRQFKICLTRQTSVEAGPERFNGTSRSRAGLQKLVALPNPSTHFIASDAICHYNLPLSV